jgi:hypothetical protein
MQQICSLLDHLVRAEGAPAIRGADVTEYWRDSLRFDVGRSDHLAPFVGLGGDMPAEIGGVIH